jgi:plastocyanin
MPRFPFAGGIRQLFARSQREPAAGRRKARTIGRFGFESLEDRALLSTVNVHIQSDVFSPAAVTINVGDTIHWIWDGSPHSTTAVSGIAESWNSGIHNAGFTFDHTFTHAGTFAYYCMVHGFDNGNGTAGGMSGMVKVYSTASVSLQSIAVTPVNPTIGVGGTEQFIATGTFSDSSTQNLTSQVTWTSSTPAVATVTASGGLATGVALGSSSITASMSGVQGATSLTVSATPPAPTPTPTPTPSTAPTLLNEQRFFAGTGARRKLVGFNLFFSTGLDSAVAQDVSHYQVVQPGATKRSHPVNVRIAMAMYNPNNSSVMLMLGKFNMKKALTLTATGLTSSTNTPAATIVTKL